MRRCCAISGCLSGRKAYNNIKKVSLFKAPKMKKTTYTTLLKADPNNEAASVMMADLAFRKVDFETAALHFRQLLLQKPTYWTALARLREVSENMNGFDEWLSRAQVTMGSRNKVAGFYYYTALSD